MYGLVGSLILITMMGVLAVAETLTVPASPLLGSQMASFILPCLLFIVATLLCMLLARRGSFSVPTGTTSRHNASDLQLLSTPRVMRYLLLFLLFIVLVAGSAWQALSQYQQLEGSRIHTPMRVQAWVTIEGISDSVYDTNTGSSYRQVATLSHITPLVSELRAKDLGDKAITQLIQNTPNKSTDVTYRVLLNAYPKNSSPTKKDNNDNNALWAQLNDLQPNEQRLMTVSLKPLGSAEDARYSPSGFDSYRWLRARHIDGTADILAVGAAFDDSHRALISDEQTDTLIKRVRIHIDQWRWQLRQHFYQGWAQKTLAEQQAQAVTLSLLTGDRSLINRDTKDLYQLAGISHLLAISGTHVLFLAIMLAGAAVLLCNRLYPQLYRQIPRWQVRWWVMVSAALIYALFTGFDVPAARTAWMLLAVGLVRLTLLPISTLRVLLGLAVVMAWFDPYVLWQAGYWLSFIAVALLLKYDDGHRQSSLFSPPAARKSELPQHTPRPHQQMQPASKATLLWSLCLRVFKLQCWLFIALLPITLLLFGKASLWGLVINLFAIALFGWVIVPLNLLAGILYVLLPVAADTVWALVSAMVASLHELLAWLTAAPTMGSAWLYTPVTTGILLMAALVLLPWLLPRGLLSRWLMLPPLTLLLMTVYAKQQAVSLTPTLYLLPTGDRQLSAALLQYPITDTSDPTTAQDSVSWLFLADHRAQDTRTMPSRLTPEQLSKTLTQQIRTLAVKRLEGIVVQSSTPELKVAKNNSNHKQNATKLQTNALLLPMTVAQLSQNVPTHHYWQAGGRARWSAVASMDNGSNVSSDNQSTITPQRCEQGKIWQLDNQALSVQAVTGWSAINDASVWDCALSLDSELPIQVVQYDATKPQQPLPLRTQRLTSSMAPTKNSQKQGSQATPPAQSRLLLDTATHQRNWQLWSLLCEADPSMLSAPAVTAGSDKTRQISRTTWLSHSQSAVTANVLRQYDATELITYDNRPLAAALSMTTSE